MQTSVTTFTKGLAGISNVAMKTIRESEKISLTECKKILNKNGNKYTDEEILAIRDWLYFIGEITFLSMENKQNEKPN